ncbi:MAG: hypothetical protein EZS28_052234 [Streblomastix strix]|uniref:Uncharacterized protein n=1 Tax=Streblomastix strix TaxID=222440 RepID=A0A5J4SED3_9EUKA|nr:MAG: hypothetical protein EZS28_052234 [Streblomastix strix]
MGDQREQEQVEAGIKVCVPVMNVQLNNNENLIDQREKEGIEGASSKIDKTNNRRKSTKDQKRGKIGWQAQVFHSIIQTRRTASIANKQINEQSCECKGWTSEMIVTRKCLTELYWWMTQLQNNKPRTIDKRYNQIIILAEASISGRGACVIKNNERIRRIYGQLEADMEKSKLREILAIYRSIQALKEYLNQQEYS